MRQIAHRLGLERRDVDFGGVGVEVGVDQPRQQGPAGEIDRLVSRLAARRPDGGDRAVDAENVGGVQIALGQAIPDPRVLELQAHGGPLG